MEQIKLGLNTAGLLVTAGGESSVPDYWRGWPVPHLFIVGNCQRSLSLQSRLWLDWPWRRDNVRKPELLSNFSFLCENEMT